MNKRRVVVTGIGVISPIGLSLKDFWNSLIQGKSGIGPITRYDVSQYASRIPAPSPITKPSLPASKGLEAF